MDHTSHMFAQGSTVLTQEIVLFQFVHGEGFLFVCLVGLLGFFVLNKIRYNKIK